jgi:hypothetical protein
LTPDYIPNSVIYASKEEIRVYKVPPSKKSINEERFKKELEARKLVADVDAKNVSSLLPPFLKSTGKCFDVERAGLFSLVKSEAEVMNYDKPAWWTVKNETGNAVAVILNQSGKDIMVAFIPVGETMSTRIPASYLKFSVRYSRDNCVDWGAVYGPTSNMPEIPFVGLNNPYLNGVFETKISNKDKQVKAETTLTGFTE